MDAAQLALYERVFDSTAGRNLSTQPRMDVDELMPDALALYEVCLHRGHLDEAAMLAGMLLLPRMGARGEVDKAEELLGEMTHVKNLLNLDAAVVMILGEAGYMGAQKRPMEAAEACQRFDQAPTLEPVDDDVAQASGVDFVCKIANRVMVHALGVRLKLGYGMAEASAEETMLPAVKRLILEDLLDSLKGSVPRSDWSSSSLQQNTMHRSRQSGKGSAASSPSDGPEAWRMTEEQRELFDEITGSAIQPPMAAKLRLAAPCELDERLPRCMDLCRNRLVEGDFDIAATLLGSLLLPRMAALGYFQDGHALLDDMAPFVARLKPKAKVIYSLGQAVFLDAAGEIEPAARVLHDYVNSEVLNGLSNSSIRIHALESRLFLGLGLDVRSRVTLQLQLGKVLCATGTKAALDQAQMLVRMAASDIVRHDLARESLLCIEVEANAMYMLGKDSTAGLARTHLGRAAKLYGTYRTRQEQLTPRLIAEEMNTRKDLRQRKGQSLTPEVEREMLEVVKEDLQAAATDVTQHLKWLKAKISPLAYTAYFDLVGNGDDELEKWSEARPAVAGLH